MKEKIEIKDYEYKFEGGNPNPKRCYFPEWREEGRGWQSGTRMRPEYMLTMDEIVEKIDEFDPKYTVRIRKVVDPVISEEQIQWEKDFALMRKHAPEWVEVSSSTLWNALGAVPPINLKGRGFAMGEAEGAGKYFCFKEYGDKSYGCLSTIQKATETNPYS